MGFEEEGGGVKEVGGGKRGLVVEMRVHSSSVWINT